MKERKGQNALNWRLFLGFGWLLTGIFADRLNLFLRSGSASAVRFLNQSPMRDLMRWLRSQNDVRFPASHSP